MSDRMAMFLAKVDVAGTSGKLKTRGAQCEAVAFIDALMERLAIEERALEGYDPITSRDLWYDLFGFFILNNDFSCQSKISIEPCSPETSTIRLSV